VLRPASPAVAHLSTLEKNWSPFVLHPPAAPVVSAAVPEREPAVYVHQWLDDPHGQAVVLRIDVPSGKLTERWATSSDGLRRALDAAPHAVISGGTPAVRLNATHLLAVGHTMTSPCNRPEVLAHGMVAREECFRGRGTWYRSYSLFAYAFEASPPFALRAATPEFRLMPALPGEAAHGFARAERPAHALSGIVNDTTVQFPVGLTLRRMPEPSGWVLELSWGYDDRESMVSVLPLATVLRRMLPLTV